ncbi:MAG: hypothetical protein ABS35_10765 [Kaistia sp. SCN 65-12]|nr:MAG: hypothetical protein ABS35_10765 [Kaistia sp. SCN 65-12]
MNKPFFEHEPELNVFGEPLILCSMNPLTGFFRNGNCITGPLDEGRHTVCAVMTDAFLAFSKSRGNDLSTPMPEYAFPGLKAGDRWCLVALRWVEALEAGMAPQVVLKATHQSVLNYVEIDVLRKYSVA